MLFIETFYYGTITDETLDHIDFSELGQNGAKHLIELYWGDMSRVLHLKDFIKFYENPKLS